MERLYILASAPGVLTGNIIARQAVRAFLSGRLNAERPCYGHTNEQGKDPDMQADLRDFLARLASTIALTLIPVAFIAFVTMPASLHHHIGNSTDVAQSGSQHMT